MKTKELYDSMIKAGTKAKDKNFDIYESLEEILI